MNLLSELSECDDDHKGQEELLLSARSIMSAGPSVLEPDNTAYTERNQERNAA